MNGDRSSLQRSAAEGYATINTTDTPIILTPQQPIGVESKRFNWNLFLDIFSIIFFFLLLLYCGSEVYLHRNDQVRKHEFSIDSVVAAAYDRPTDNKINSGWNLMFNVTNRSNNSTFFYENVAISGFYGDQILWATMLPNFYQHVGDHSALKMSMVSSSAADGAYFPKGFIYNNRKLNMSPGIDVKLIATVTEHSKVLSQHSYQVVVFCPNIKMKLDSAQDFLKFTGASRQCQLII
ncbi:hypothetical protein DCAR_0831997 [Daucus carota subsp. sativus]|uniref:Late embryogenesis abundant protein LEA-2 subgroup domain-containing protein n=1 Tax=Daucus carota subsp. sativus TaxID=79200 RepID=A0A175YNK9_DAUCS|nr:hypothetical protein DCAR_0831997 [Daucus carota subsp. sativus]